MVEENNKIAIRVAGIVMMNDGVVFMHRKNVIRNKDYQEYYTFPGGHLEEGETEESDGGSRDEPSTVFDL